MKTLFLAIFFCFWAATFIFAQNYQEVTENTPANFDGLVLGFVVKNFRKQEVKGVPHDRYELAFFVSNKRNGDISVRFTGKETVRDLQYDRFNVAHFICQNATGARLTSSEATFRLKEQYFHIKDAAGKESNLLVGYFLGKGETLESEIIVIVKEGEKLQIKAKANY